MKFEKNKFTLDELNEIRRLVTSEMLKCSDILDKISASDYLFNHKLFSYWDSRYQALQSIYDKIVN